ncbi:MAG: ATP-binding protein [Leptospirales bacterium]|jgi:magnesium chelatase family protein
MSQSSLKSPRRDGGLYAALPALYLCNPFQAIPITTEAMIRRGLPAFQISGLAPARDIADRIRSALRCSGEKSLSSGANIQVNLAPVDLRKSGAYLDLSIAVSIMRAAAQARPPHSASPAFADHPGSPTVYLGELALDGRLRPVPRLPALLRESRRLGFRRAILPACQIHEARLIPGIRCTGIDSLAELTLRPGEAARQASPVSSAARSGSRADPGRDGAVKIRGVAPALTPLLDQLELDPRARRALSIAAAGWHSMLLIGPPGTGKSSLARSVAPLLAPPSQAESLEILIGGDRNTAIGEGVLEIQRPVRAPHHSCTRTAMVGGGTPVAPGEITRANHGVLLLDELAEFSRDTLQGLREPMETGYIDLSRGRENARFPARFLLIATTNPCPCGRHRLGKCNCGPVQIRQYINRILGPLRDRIDLEVRVEGVEEQDERVPGKLLLSTVERARSMQSDRFANTAIATNGEIPAAELERYIRLDLSEAREEWKEFARSRRHSHRSLAGLRRVARTIADLEGSPEIRATDLQEALYYRCLDHYWS